MIYNHLAVHERFERSYGGIKIRCLTAWLMDYIKES